MEASNRHILERLLNSRFEFLQIRNESFDYGFHARSEVVPSSRFILFTSGEIVYRIENQDINCVDGVVLFVPPWVWREWEVVSIEPASLVWTVFSTSERVLNTMEHAVAIHPDNYPHLAAGMKRLHSIAPAPFIYKLGPEVDDRSLLLEGEMKSVLANFFTEASIRGDSPASERHPEVDYAMRWLQAHYDIPSALSELNEQTSLNPAYLREIFRQQVHQSPNEYLTVLRMRAARYFLRQGSMSVKEVAVRTGYQDSLYFSRVYRRFWKRPPSKDRLA